VLDTLVFYYFIKVVVIYGGNVVLARKYRPRVLGDLYGQDVVARTLRNSFETGKIAQSYMLTGMRGVGKTTVARILARAMNYEIPGEIEEPVLVMPREGIHCRDIIEGRHIDVIEIDAASHSGIQDIRDLADCARYRPLSARVKVYIIDEVHMLSNAAFNGLLKTLEEPHAHVRFILATTELRKVPITVVSRCQVFRLCRVSTDELTKLLARVCELEEVTASNESLRCIASVSEGSARDALSILEQAIVFGEGCIEKQAVLDMLGRASSLMIVDLFRDAMMGDAASVLRKMSEQFNAGVDPVIFLSDLAEFVHFLTKLKILGEAILNDQLSEFDVEAGLELSSKLSIPVLGRAWQILLDGIEEVRTAENALAASDMVLIRLCYSANLPTPDEVIKLVLEEKDCESSDDITNACANVHREVDNESGCEDADHLSSSSLSIANGLDVIMEEGLSNFQSVGSDLPKGLCDVAKLAAKHGDLSLKLAIEQQMHQVSFRGTRIEILLDEVALPSLPIELNKKLDDWTGVSWQVIVSKEIGGGTVDEEQKNDQESFICDAQLDPMVLEVLRCFKGAKVVDVRVSQN